jgi:hypothetical protein
MVMNTSSAGAQEVRPITTAQRKTARIRKQLKVAHAELNLTNEVLEKQLPASVKQGEVGTALAQREAIEEKVEEAAQELSAVHQLLDEEVAQRERLEKKLAEATASGSGSA